MRVILKLRWTVFIWRCHAHWSILIEFFVGWKIIKLNQPINRTQGDVVLWKIHNSSLLTATSPQRILATISVSPKPKFLTRTLTQAALPLDTSGRTSSTTPPCQSVPVWWKRTLQSLLTLERMVQLRLLNLPHWQPKRRERLAAGKLVEEPDAD